MTPEAIHNALVNGKMQLQGAALSDPDRRAVSEFLAGRPSARHRLGGSTKCTASPAMSDPARGAELERLGQRRREHALTRRTAALTAADLPKLKLKWAFGYAGVNAARAQPAIAGGRLFVASENGEVHALDPKTGCTLLDLQGRRPASARRSSVGPVQDAPARSGYAVYFGDARANAYAVDASTGQQIWVRKVDEHPSAAITGAPTCTTAASTCRCRGSTRKARAAAAATSAARSAAASSALDANTGAVVWKTYTIDEPKPRGKNKDGVQMWGPAGGGIWAAPTVDAKRGIVYVATGNGYADPSQTMTDAVVALDMDTGTVKWVNQVTPNDNWTLGCRPQNPDNPACPATLGPDYDFSASPALATRQRPRAARAAAEVRDGVRARSRQRRRDRVAAPHRPGQRPRRPVGRRRRRAERLLRRGGPADAEPGRHARASNLATGEIGVERRPQPRLCAHGAARAARRRARAVTAIPGAVLLGLARRRDARLLDEGRLDPLDVRHQPRVPDGQRREGQRRRHRRPGAVVAGGMLFVNSGYGGFIGNPGNVLLAFGID